MGRIHSTQAQRVFPDGIALSDHYVEGIGLIPFTAWGGVTNYPVGGMSLSLGQLAGVHPSTGLALDPTNWLPSIAVHTAVVMAIETPPGFSLTLSNLILQGDGFYLTNLNLSTYGLATGTPLYAYTETDPAFAGWLETNTYLKSESDPVWSAASNNYFTRTESDTRYLHSTSNLADVTNPQAARTHLQLGSISTQNASSVHITGGTIQSTTISNSVITLIADSSLEMNAPGTFGFLTQMGSYTAQIGGAESTILFPGNIEVLGTQIIYQANTLILSTNHIILNRDGTLATALSAGILIEQDGITSGYFRVSPSSEKMLQVKAPGGSNLFLVATNTEATLTIRENVSLPDDFVAIDTYTSDTNAIWQRLSQSATGTPLYVESDPAWAAEKANYATGTPLYAFTEADPAFSGWLGTNTYVKTESDPLWNAEKANYATGTPLYAYTESDPVFLAQKAQFATGTPLYVESDPTWAAEKANYATGTPLYAFTEADPAFTNWLETNTYIQTESDPLWNAEKANYATGTPLYAYTESDPVFIAQKAQFATGTPLYVESDPVWIAERSNYATGTPLYAFTEADPAFTNWLETNTYIQTESDPLWNAEKANYATGTPLYAYTESDPVFLAQKAQFATGTPLYAFTEADPAFTTWLDTNTYVQTESDPVWNSEKSGYWTKTLADDRFLQSTGNLSELTDVPLARSNLLLGTIATQQFSQVTLTGGQIQGVLISNVTLYVQSGGALDVTAPGNFQLLPSIGASTLQLGGSESDILIPGNLEVSGTQTVYQSSSLMVSTNFILVNKDGTASTVLGAGLYMEHDATTAGYFRVSTAQSAHLQMKAPTGSNLVLIVTNKAVSLTVTDDVSLPADFALRTTYTAATTALWQASSQEQTSRIQVDTSLSNHIATLQSGKLDSNVWATAASTTNIYPKTGGTVNGNAAISGTLSVSGHATLSSAVTLGSNTTSATAGMIRWNPSASIFEGYNGSAWIPLGNVYSD